MKTPPEREAFWRRWTDWRHGEAGGGNFADVMRVLLLYERFAGFCARHAPPGAALTVLDLGCGAAQLARPLREALGARGQVLERYLGVDFADPEWMPRRVAREFAAQHLGERAEYQHHDLAAGLPPGLQERLGGSGPLLIASCWGITYLDPEALGALLEACRTLASARTGGTLLCVNMLTEGQFDRDVLTRKFVTRVIPRQALAAARRAERQPLRELRLAMRALPRMRAFGTELREVVCLMRVERFLEVLASRGLSAGDVDSAALWGQTTSLAVRLS